MPRIDASTQRTPCACSSITLAAGDRGSDRRRPVAEAGAEPELDLGDLTLVSRRRRRGRAPARARPASSPKRQTSRPTSLRRRQVRASPRSSPCSLEERHSAARSGRRSGRCAPSGSAGAGRTPARSRRAPPAARPVLAWRMLERLLEERVRLRELAELDEHAADVRQRSAWSATAAREVRRALEEVQRRRQVAAKERALAGGREADVRAVAAAPPHVVDRAELDPETRTPARGGSR